jgi:hypothetical protein
MSFRDPRSLAVLAASLVLPSSLVAQDRVDPIPTGPAAVVEALSPFAGSSDSSRVATILGDAARTSEFPASDYDRVLVARLWRRAGKTDLAMKALAEVDRAHDDADLATYETARVLMEAEEADRDADGLHAYWTACGSSDDRVRAEIAWDILPETLPTEREAWRQVPAGAPTCDWLRAFWDERAQRMVVPPAERIALHFSRMAHARRDYYLAAPRALAGMADSFGRAPGLAIDDRGLLYVRMGAPAHDEACPEEVATVQGNSNHPLASLPNRLDRCWVYEGQRGYRIFHFAMKDRFKSTGSEGEVYGPQTWPDGDYRIQEDLGQRAEPGNAFFHKYVMNADLPRETKTALIRRGAAFRVERLIRDSVMLPLNFRDPAADAWTRSLSALEARRYDRGVTIGLRRFASAALEQIPDIPEIARTADLKFEALRFLNPAAAQWHVWLLAAVPAGQLARSSGDAAAATIDIGGRFSVLEAEGMSLYRVAPLSVPARAVGADAGVSIRGVAPVEPGPLPFTFIIEDLNRPGTGAWIQDTINIPAVGGLPRVSDIAVAQAEGGSWTRDGRTYLQVTPAHVTNPDGSIHTYFEVYGVRPGAPYEVELRLAPVDAADRIWRLEPDDLGFRLQFTSLMPGDIGRHHLRLDLGETEPGAYVLAVRIQDEQSKAYSLPAVTDIFVAER